MSEHRKKRKEALHNQSDPINFTCGKCKQVVPYQAGYICPNCDVKEVKEVE